MSGLFDVLLDQPIPEALFRPLLFFSFMLHFFFVLLTVGSAILGVTFYVWEQWGPHERPRGWDRDFLSLFFVHKSLAVVFGVGPLLLMQVGNTIPFMTAASLFSPLWLLIIVLLIASFLLLEWVAVRPSGQRWRFLLVGLAGLTMLLAVPGIFVAVLSVTERPATWDEFLALGGRLPRELGWHWLMRYLHVLGTAILFAAAFHYFKTAEEDQHRRRILAAWMAGSIAAQFALGLALFASLGRMPQFLILFVLMVGVLAASGLMALVFRGQASRRQLSAGPVLWLLFLILTPMLLTRQMLRDAVLIPVNRQLEQNAADYERRLSPLMATGMTSPAGLHQPTPLIEPGIIYMHSCAICHSAVGNGLGKAASELDVPPEDIAAMRMSDQTLRRILLEGIPGTSMPRFGFYTAGQLEGVIAFLRGNIGLLAAPAPAPTTAPADSARGLTVFYQTCTVCHGPDGRGTALSAGFSPPPPDLTLIGFTPSRAFEVISRGYPGTMMPSFAELPESTRWGLVQVVSELYQGNEQVRGRSRQ